ncbi:MAG: DUF3830 family protein [Nitrospinota bacterium]
MHLDRERLRRDWDEAWNEKWARHLIPEADARRFEIDLNGVKARGGLLERGAPKTCEACWKSLPIRGHAIHAAWSGDMIRYVEKVNLPVGGFENVMTYGAPGHLTYDAEEREVALVYGVCGFRMPSGPHRLTVFGQITENLAELARMCARTRLEGVMPIELRAVAD